MEKAVGWPEYAIDRIYADSTYVPPRHFVYLHPQTSTVEQVLKFITKFQAARPTEFPELRQAVLDVTWLTTDQPED